MCIRDRFGNVPMVAVFDTAFHSTMPPKAYMYAIPYEYYEKYGGEHIEAGMTTWELDKLIYDFIVKHGGTPNFKGLYGLSLIHI